MAGVKHDKEKPMMHLIPLDVMEDVARVLTFGAKKYGEGNWAEGIESGRLLGGVLRHLTAYQKGELTDPESGLPHLSHAICGMLFLSWMHKHKPEFDTLWTRKLLTDTLEQVKLEPCGQPLNSPSISQPESSALSVTLSRPIPTPSTYTTAPMGPAMATAKSNYPQPDSWTNMSPPQPSSRRNAMRSTLLPHSGVTFDGIMTGVVLLPLITLVALGIIQVMSWLINPT